MCLMLRLFFIISSIFLSFWMQACGDPCRELADMICECQPTRAKVDRCKNTVNVASKNLDVSDDQEDRCQQILDNGLCNCSAIKIGNLSYCGLTEDPSLLLDDD